MNQKIRAEVVLTIPEDKILISLQEYENLLESNYGGRVINLKKFSSLLSRSERWVKENLLEDKVFKRKLDAKNGGFVHYPEFNGDPYSFLEDEARKFIQENFERIFSK